MEMGDVAQRQQQERRGQLRAVLTKALGPVPTTSDQAGITPANKHMRTS